MADYLYLIRNNDLYKIGITDNLIKKFKILNPDEIIKTIKLDDPKSFQARLFRRYKSDRVPDTEYFRLSREQLSDCVNQFSSKGILPSTLGAEFDITLSGSALLIFFSVIISYYFRRDITNSLSLSFGIGSIPMWGLFLFGNFGGYDNNDLPLFSSLGNRFKALIFAISTTSIAYTILSINK